MSSPYHHSLQLDSRPGLPFGLLFGLVAARALSEQPLAEARLGVEGAPPPPLESAAAGGQQQQQQPIWKRFLPSVYATTSTWTQLHAA